MVSEEGGRWDVGIKDNAVYIERRNEDNESLFEAQLEPEEARELARLLKKFADKADSTDEDASRDKDETDDEEDSSDKDDSDESDDEEDSSDKDDSDDEDDSTDKRSSD